MWISCTTIVIEIAVRVVVICVDRLTIAIIIIITFNGKNFPDEPVSTQGARFLQYQLIASDLAGGLQTTQEYEDSIIMARNDSSGIRYKNCLSDGTSFMLVVI